MRTHAEFEFARAALIMFGELKVGALKLGRGGTRRRSAFFRRTFPVHTATVTNLDQNCTPLH